MKISTLLFKKKRDKSNSRNYNISGMKNKKVTLFGILILMAVQAWGQTSISLSPSNISPSSYTLLTYTAGSSPTNPITNYTSQSVKYTWPFLGDNVFGALYVSSSTIPSGLTMTIQATGGSGWWDMYGTSTGTQTVTDSYQALISGIWSASNRTRGLTQNLFISNFSDLHPGDYSVNVSFMLY